MFYSAVLEFVHFTIYEVSSAHTPNRNALCVCWCGCMYVSSVQMCLHSHLYCSCSCFCVVHLYASMCQKTLQQIHMYLINADDNTPKSVEKKTNGNKKQYNYSEILEWCHILNEQQNPVHGT